MPKLTRAAFIVLVFSFLFSSNLFAQNFDKKDWKLKTSKKDLKVFTRKSEQSDVKEIRIQTTVNAPLKKIMEVLNDVDGYKKWVYKSMSAKKIKIISPKEYYYYTKSDFPFPIADRDLVVLSKQWEDKKTGYVYSHSEAAPSMMANEKGTVRVTLFESYWKIMPQENGSVKIDYVALTHPGGNIPAWVVNLGITRGPVVTMKQFADLVEGKGDSKNQDTLSGDD